MKMFILASSILFGSQAFADQCAYVSVSSAVSAVKLISISAQRTGGVLSLCQNCGETAPKEIQVEQIDIHETGVPGVPAQVSINGDSIDLAYTYVSLSKGQWTNLATLSNCDVTGESSSITEKVSAKGRVKYIVGVKDL